jgi:hypothetical protein
MAPHLITGALARGALAAAVAAIAQGCAQPPPQVPGGWSPAAAAVVVDFFAGSSFARSCSGTLLAQNLVLTAAHCASGSTGAVVSAPSLSATSKVSRVYRYDWVDGVPYPDQHRDLALMVLRTPMVLPSYPHITSCSRCTVSQVASMRGGRPVVGPQQVMSSAAPADQPYARYIGVGIPDSGGAVYRVGTGRAAGTIVGVAVGQGESTGGGYVLPLDDANVLQWIGTMALVASNPGGSAQTHPLDEGDDTGDSTGDGSGVDNSAGGDYSNPVDDGGDQGSSQDPGTNQDPGGTGEDTSSSSGGTDPSSGNDTSSSGNGTDPAAGADAAAEPPTTPESVTDSSRGVGLPDGFPNNYACNGAICNDVAYSQSGLAFVDPSATLGPSGGTWQPLGTTDSTTSPNAVGFYPTGDGAFSSAPAEAATANAAGYNYFVSHGFRDGVKAPYDPSMATSLMSNGDPTLMANCFAGAPGPNVDCNGAICNGPNGANLFAQAGGADPANVWGCTSWVINGPSCDISDGGNGWVNGNGQTMSASAQQQLGVTCYTKSQGQVPCPTGP